MTTVSDLIVEHLPMMRYRAFNLSRDDGEDIVQSACVAALRSTTPVSEIRVPGAWLNVHVHNAYRVMLRHRNRHPSGEKLLESVPMSAPPTQEEAIDITRFVAMAGKLPGKMATAFRLVALNEYSLQEAGAQMGMSKQAVHLYVKAARKKLGIAQPLARAA